MSNGLLFVCGFPSSGTDLLRNILNAHEQINIGGEFPLLPTLAVDYGARVPADAISAAQDAIRRIDIYENLRNPEVTLSSESTVDFSDLFAAMLFPERVAWIGSKTPQNTENMDKLLQLFPSSRYLIVIRDVRDVAMSWGNKWGKSMLLCAHKWQSRMGRSLETTTRMPPGQYLYVRYEGILENMETEARRICEFLRIPFDDKMLNYQDFVAEEVPGKINFGQPIIKNNSGKWADGLKPSELERIEQIAMPVMRRYGYEVQIADSHKPIRRFELIAGMLRDVIAMMTVGNRSLKHKRLGYRLTQLRVLSLKLVAQALGKLH